MYVFCLERKPYADYNDPSLAVYSNTILTRSDLVASFIGDFVLKIKYGSTGAK